MSRWVWDEENRTIPIPFFQSLHLFCFPPRFAPLFPRNLGPVVTNTPWQTGHKEMFFNALKSKQSPPLVRPIEDQEERESQRLWQKTAEAVRDRNHELATDEKTKIEDTQRQEAAARAADGVEWHPRLFRAVKGGPEGSEEGLEDLEWIINTRM
jgi:hypothetical protein